MASPFGPREPVDYDPLVHFGILVQYGSHTAAAEDRDIDKVLPDTAEFGGVIKGALDLHFGGAGNWPGSASDPDALTEATDTISAHFMGWQDETAKKFPASIVVPVSIPIAATLYQSAWGTSPLDELLDMDFFRDVHTFETFTSSSGNETDTWTPTQSHPQYKGIPADSFDIDLTIATTGLPSDGEVQLSIRFVRETTSDTGQGQIVTGGAVVLAPGYSQPTLGATAGDQVWIPAVWDGARVIVGQIIDGAEVEA